MTRGNERQKERNDIKDKRRNKKKKRQKGGETRRREEKRRAGDFQWTQCGFLKSTRDLKLNESDWIKVTCARLLAGRQNITPLLFLVRFIYVRAAFRFFFRIWVSVFFSFFFIFSLLVCVLLRQIRTITHTWYRSISDGTPGERSEGKNNRIN